nr:exopolysaccharide biosynthesis protein [Nitratireductor sp.]
VALQLVIGYRKPLLPRKIRFRELRIGTFRNIVSRIEPLIIRFERVARPRLWLLPQRVAEQLIGGISLLMGLMLVLPIPFGNFPPALAVIVMCLGLGERDGVWTGAGILLSILATGIVIGVLATAGAAMFSVL